MTPGAIQLSSRFRAQTQTHLPAVSLPRWPCRPLSSRVCCRKSCKSQLRGATFFCP